jgi:hypothetical protein
MKAPKIIWPFLLLVTGFICWLSPSAPPVRIRVENDVADISGAAISSPADATGYDSYFIPVKNFQQILIPAGKSK